MKHSPNEKSLRVNTGTTRSQQAPPLPAERAFIVQFRAPEESHEDLGRVEHLESGQATHFQSWAELQAFIEQALTQLLD